MNANVRALREAPPITPFYTSLLRAQAQSGRPRPIARPRFPRLQRLLRALAPSAYDREVGGYVHDTAMSQFFGPNDAHIATGTWTDTAGGVAGTVMRRKTAADNTGIVTQIITLPQNSVSQKGSYIRSVDCWWINATADMDAVTALFNLAVLPATGAVFAAVSTPAFTYDTGHDAAAERITQDEHKMTCTITTPIWLDDDDLLHFQITANAAATSLFDWYGCRANYTLRL